MGTDELEEAARDEFDGMWAVCFDDDGEPLAELQGVMVGGEDAANHIDSHWLYDHG